METDSLNQSLLKIEQNLKNLDSARSQVENVITSGENLSETTKMLAHEVRVLADKIKQETSTVIINFSKKLDTFEERYKTSISQNLDTINKEIEEFKNATSVLNKNADKSISELKTISADTLQKQKEEVSRATSIILELAEKIQSLISELTSMNIPERFDNLQSTTSQIYSDSQISLTKLNDLATIIESSHSELVQLQKKEQKKSTISNYITWAIIGICTIAVIYFCS